MKHSEFPKIDLQYVRLGKNTDECHLTQNADYTLCGRRIVWEVAYWEGKHWSGGLCEKCREAKKDTNDAR